jgi:hypothetical protein
LIRVKPKFVAAKGFSGTARSGNGTLRVESVDLKDIVAGVFGIGTFEIEMIVTGPALPGGRPLRLKILFSPNGYRFENGLVTDFNPE